MELYLQFGSKMMSMCRSLVGRWQSGTVILSPRDLEPKQMKKFSSDLHALNGSVVFDPQFYIPHADHKRLVSHTFWPSDYQTAFFDQNEIRRMLQTLDSEYNSEFGSSFFILPGHQCSEVNEDWYNLNSIIVNEAIRLNLHESIYATLCFSNDVMCSEEQIHQALEYLETWNVQGCYIVPEPPGKNYLVDNPSWIINLLDLVTGLKHQGKKVVVGYANHQLLCLSLAKTDAIASGNWINVRSFNPEKFNNPEGEGGRRSIWYYSPQMLSEYQIPYLDIALRFGVLNELKADSAFDSDYSDPLFSGAQPSTVNFKDSDSFCHYLHCLRRQSLTSVKSTYSETREGLKIQLETAQALTETMIANGIKGKNRDFSNVVDTTISAILAYDHLRGMMQSHMWDKL